MCGVCCKECVGWCKSFTFIERLLVLLEAILLAVFLAFLLFLILHLVACPVTETSAVTKAPDVQPTPIVATVSPGIKCTWKPSLKTPAVTHYYESSSLITSATIEDEKTSKDSSANYDDNVEPFKESDGEYARTEYKNSIMALVKLRPPRDATFGCILTVISNHWTLTAASCIEEIEEVDSLDSFIMMQNYGEAKRGRTYVVSDVRVHPLYRGANGTYDLAALETDGDLIKAGMTAVTLSTTIDYLLITIGQRLVILGYGTFRSVEPRSSQRRLREVAVRALPRRQCPAGAGAGAGAWAEAGAAAARHLVPLPSGGEGGGAAACGAGAALCAGVLRARPQPCNYCSGTPLLADSVPPLLLAVQADNHQCGIACEPALYSVVAECRDWIDSLLTNRRRRDLKSLYFPQEAAQRRAVMNKALLACSLLMAVFVVGCLASAVMQLVAAASAPASAPAPAPGPGDSPDDHD